MARKKKVIEEIKEEVVEEQPQELVFKEGQEFEEVYPPQVSDFCNKNGLYLKQEGSKWIISKAQIKKDSKYALNQAKRELREQLPFIAEIIVKMTANKEEYQEKSQKLSSILDKIKTLQEESK